MFDWFTIKNLFVAALFHFLGYTPAPDAPGTPWAFHTSSAAAGYAPAKLDELALLADGMANDAIVVVVDGKVLWEYGNTEALSYLASVRKSLLAMLYGPYVADGTINLDLTLADLGMDDVQGLLPIEKQARVRDLISARSGVYHPASNAGDNLADAPPRGSQQPGAYYLYSNWDFNAAGTAFERMTGKSIYDAFDEKLARPLGFEHWRRLIHLRNGDTDQSEHLAYHFVLSTQDMARLGELVLRQGKWQGEQIVPASWVQDMISLVTPNQETNPAEVRNSEFGYGYMWWVWDGPKVTCAFEGAYTGRGAYGQFITVLPTLDMVVAHKTLPDARTSWEEYVQILDALVAARVTPACQDQAQKNALAA